MSFVVPFLVADFVQFEKQGHNSATRKSTKLSGNGHNSATRKVKKYRPTAIIQLLLSLSCNSIIAVAR